VWYVLSMAPKKPRRAADEFPAGKPIAVLLPESLLQRLDSVAQEMDMSRANVIRMATKIGLEQLKRVDFDIARLVVDANNPPPLL
jgi:hypothetical protein